MHEWKRKQLIGLSVKNWQEFIRAVVTINVNMVEIKLEKFAENGMPLYAYRKGKFYLNHKNLALIAETAKKHAVAVQFHLPIERCVDASKDVGINVGFIAHHKIALARFIMLEKIYRKYGIGSVITVHPPTVSFNDKKLIEVEVALENSRIFFEELDALRLEENHQTLIGIENQTASKVVAACLCSDAEHFKTMLRNTRTIGVTIDSGHRLLAENFTVTELLGFALAVNNFHFHGNQGEFNAINYDDDEHKLPTPKNVKGYKNYIRYFCRHRTPVVLEIANLEQYSDKTLTKFISDLKCETL